MARILGLDLGTSSIGWAVTDRTEWGYELIDQGVAIFQEGVEREHGIEQPSVKRRTDARALRRHYFRRRLRKIELLKVLVEHDMCPYLSPEQLHLWHTKKIYPKSDDFIRWQRTDDNTDRNPYHDRYTALTSRLDLSLQRDRYVLGRALYHLAQRRGFLSNRKDTTDEKETGKVKSGISELSAKIAEAGCTYLGEYFYMAYRRGEKIRTQYTSRTDHYLMEFDAICALQQLPEELTKALRRAIFFQRPLKSQKGSVGRCTFERDKARCPLSHPRFEEFRMLQFINNIRIETPADTGCRPLTAEEIGRIRPLFTRKKSSFDFEDIAKKLAGKGRYACIGDRCEAPYKFNYRMKTSVAGCPVTAELRAALGDDWRSELRSRYTLAAGKSDDRIADDIWHALFSFDNDERLREWLRNKVQLTEEEADKLVKCRLPQGYASLSLNAIDKMLPYLREGYRYDEAVFLANLGAVLPPDTSADERHAIEREIAAAISGYKRNPYDKYDTKEGCISKVISDHGIDARTDRLYHPSMIETYPKAAPDADGTPRLGSPRTSSIRNPMAMRALFRLRQLVNTLLRTGVIDGDTKVNIEFSRMLNSANMRRAIERYQRENETERQKAVDAIRAEYADATGRTIEPTDEDILKYLLWKEQNKICLYTGDSIGISQFLGDDPLYDIEHTVPRSRGGDDSRMNKTLCERRFNREDKGAKLPSELSCHAEILARIETAGWNKTIDELRERIGKLKYATGDEAIQNSHYWKMKLDYWRGKYERFTMQEVPEGFSNRQGVDIGIIGKYARAYLKSVFDNVYIVKGETTSDFRKAWGLQEEYEKKDRSNHSHHCIDAITIACIKPRDYDEWTRYVVAKEAYEAGRGNKPNLRKPWPTFTEDVKAIAERLLISHHTADNMSKSTRKKLRIRGKVQRTDDGRTKYAQGDSARGSLHKETFYGAIEREGEIKYVVRKRLGLLKESDIDKIIDPAVREKVRAAVDRYGFKEAKAGTIYMNEQKGIPINKVRILTGVVSPLKFEKQHRDLSPKEYKRNYYVVNDVNYCMAIYESVDSKGNANREFELITNIDAARHFKRSADRTSFGSLVPEKNLKGYPLKYVLKTGTMVLFYENTPEELYDCTERELAKRLYEVKIMAVDGRVTFIFHQDARDSKLIKAECGDGVSTFDAMHPAAKLRLSASKIKALVEGFDFELSVTGKIEFKHR